MEVAERLAKVRWLLANGQPGESDCPDVTRHGGKFPSLQRLAQPLQ